MSSVKDRVDQACWEWLQTHDGVIESIELGVDNYYSLLADPLASIQLSASPDGRPKYSNVQLVLDRTDRDALRIVGDNR